MLDFLTKMFRREESSRSAAKERLRLVLMSDRVALAPDTFDTMKGEMLGVLQRYLDIDMPGIDVHFENAERRFMLYANIPVTHIKSSEQIEQERQRRAVGANGNGVHSPTGGRRRRRRRRNRNGATQHESMLHERHNSGDHPMLSDQAQNGTLSPETPPTTP